MSYYREYDFWIIQYTTLSYTTTHVLIKRDNTLNNLQSLLYIPKSYNFILCK